MSRQVRCLLLCQIWLHLLSLFYGSLHALSRAYVTLRSGDTSVASALLRLSRGCEPGLRSLAAAVSSLPWLTLVFHGAFWANCTRACVAFLAHLTRVLMGWRCWLRCLSGRKPVTPVSDHRGAVVSVRGLCV